MQVSLSEIQAILVDIRYRLTPEVEHSDCVSDVYEAVHRVISPRFGDIVSRGTIKVYGGNAVQLTCLRCCQCIRSNKSGY